MKKHVVPIQSIFIVLILLLAFACTKDEMIDYSSFSSVIASVGAFDDVPEVENETELSSTESEETREGVKWNCTTRTVKAEAAAGGQGGFPSYNPNASVIYPGNLLQGASLDQATPDIIAVKRTGGVISTDVIDGSMAPYFEVDEINKSQVTLALNQIVANSTGVIPSNFDFQYYNVQSEEEFAMKARMSVKTMATSFNGRLEFSSEKSYNRYYITLNQSYYTMSYDIPTSLDEVFAPEVVPEDLGKYTGFGNPACYISDVTYGRIFTMLVESTSSVTDMEAAVSGAFRGIGAKVKGEVEVDYFKSLNDLKIQVFAFGGKDDKTLETIGTHGDLNKLVSILAEASDIRTGKPISYVARSVYDNQIVSVKLATEYDVKECIPTIDPDAPPYTRHWAGLSKDFGGVGAMYSTGGSSIVLINLEGTEYMESDIGQLNGPYPISNLAGGQEPPFEAIGAITQMDHQNSQTLCIDQTGALFCMIEDGKWSSPNFISDLGSDNPFIIEGFGAAYLAGEFGTSTHLGLANYLGTKLVIYSPHQRQFSLESDWTGTLSTLGAVTSFKLGNEDIFIAFDVLGTSYYVTGYVAGETRTFGPYKI